MWEVLLPTNMVRKVLNNKEEEKGRNVVFLPYIY